MSNTRQDPLNVFFYAGPGAGKSTTTALSFGTEKQKGRNAEIAHEFAKDLTWEGRGKALGYQPYIFGKQTYKHERLRGQVELVLSDTSPLLSLIYPPPVLPSWWNEFQQFVLAYYRSLNRLNVYLTRDPSRPYNPKGRNQTEEEAHALDNEVQDLLLYTGEQYHEVQVDKATNSHVEVISRLIADRLGS